MLAVECLCSKAGDSCFAFGDRNKAFSVAIKY